MFERETLTRWAAFLNRYRRRIVTLSIISFVVIAVSLVVLYLVVPSHRTTSLPFRLEFENAESGRYPNGTPFSTADIVATPILREVFEANELRRFTTFPAFSSALFILEANTALEALTREYEAKLADYKLTSVDRERLEREFQLKRESLSRSEYSINFLSTSQTARIPRKIIEKVLNDTLATWARKAAEEKGILRYRLPRLTRGILPQSILQEENAVVALDVLRSKANHVLRLIELMLDVPGAEVIRTSGGISLDEIRQQLNDTIRFSIQPTLAEVRRTGVRRPGATMDYLRTQLEYNRLRQRSGEAKVAALKEALDRYSRTNGTPVAANATEGQSATGESVTPQVTEGFIDRIIALANDAEDTQYRQARVREISAASLEVIPYYSETIFYETFLQELEGLPAGDSMHDPMVRAGITRAYGEIGDALGKVNEIYAILSSYLNPATELFSLQAPPRVEIQHPLSPARLAVIGFLLFVLSVIAIILGLWLHARMTS